MYGGGGYSQTWEKVSLTDLTTDDVFVIVGTISNKTYALPNTETNKKPAAVAITISTDGNQITGDVTDNLKWNIEKSEEKYTFYPNGNKKAWLYSSSTSTNLGIGSTGTNKTFKYVAISSKQYEGLLNTSTNRYICIYSNNDWRAYANNNITATKISYYKYTTSSTSSATTTTFGTYSGKTFTFTNGTLEGFTTPTATATKSDDKTDLSNLIEYTSTDADIVTVNSKTGELTFTNTKFGKATITATLPKTATYQTSTDSYVVENKDNHIPTSLSFNGTDVTLTEGKTDAGADFTGYTATEANNIAGTITYAASGDAVATVDPTTGAVTINAAVYGTTTITATFTPADLTQYSGSTATYQITNKKAVDLSEITFNVSEDKVSDTGNKTLTKSIVKINTSSGSLGASTDYRFYSGSKTTFSLTDPTRVITSIKFVVSSGTTYKNFTTDKNTYDKATATWTGYEESVVFTASSQVRNVTQIIVTTAEKKPAPALSFAEATVTKELVAGTIDLQTITKPEDLDASAITYASSDDATAKVEGTTIRLYKTGEVIITATSAATDKYAAGTASYKLVIVDNRTATAIAFDGFDGTTVALTDGKTADGAEFKGYTAKAADNIEGTIKYAASGDAVATVDETTGAVTVNATTYGTTTITATFTPADPTKYTTSTAEYKITNEKGKIYYTTLAAMKEAVPTDATSSAPATLSLNLTDAIVTSVADKKAAIQDATAGTLVYGNNALGLVKGKKYTGKVDVKACWFSGYVEIVGWTPSADIVVEDATELPLETITLAQFKAEPDKYEFKRVKVSKVTTTSAYSTAKKATITQDGTDATLFGEPTGLSVSINTIYDLIGCAYHHKTSSFDEYRIGIFAQEDITEIEKETPALSFAEATVTKELVAGTIDLQTITKPEDLDASAITYASSDDATAKVEAKVEGTTIRLYKTGEVTITATSAATDKYAAGTASYKLIISDSRKDAALAVKETLVKVKLGEGVYNLASNITCDNGLNSETFKYTSSDNSYTIVDNLIEFDKVGTTTITAQFDGNDSYKPAEVSYTFEVEDPRTTDAAFKFAAESYSADLAEATEGIVTFNAADVLQNPNNLKVTYTISPESANATIGETDGEALIEVSGTYTITAIGAANDTYKETTATCTLKVINSAVEETSIEFVAGVDKGNNSSTTADDTVEKGCVLISSKNAALGRDDNYRFYSSTHTISTKIGKITKIEFIGNDTKNPLTNLTSKDNNYTSTNSNYGVWVGSAKDVVFTNDKQARATNIIVTVEVPKAKNYTLDETKAKNVIETYENANVTLQRTLSKDYWNTFCVPFALDAEQVAQYFGEGTQLRTYEGNCNDNIVYFATVDNIEAGKPYIMKPGNAVVQNPTFEGVSMVATGLDEKGNPQAVGDASTVQMKGIYNQILLNADQTELFLGDNDLFYYPLDDIDARTIGGLRAYFIVPQGTDIKKLRANLDGTPTSLGTIFDTEESNAPVYNLQGQCVGNSLRALKSGIYIQNGKKVVVK